MSTTQIEYHDVVDAPPSWNNSDYGTATCQVLLTNTSVGQFNLATQTAVMNVVHSYLVADGFQEVFYLGVVSISQYLVRLFCCSEFPQPLGLLLCSTSPVILLRLHTEVATKVRQVSTAEVPAALPCSHLHMYQPSDLVLDCQIADLVACHA